MNMTPRLQRSRTDTMIAGVASGVAQYLGVDPVVVRLLFVLLTLSGPGLLIYLLLWLVMPREPAAPQAPGQVFVATGETQRLRIDPSTGMSGDPEQEIPVNNLGARPAPAAGGAQGNRVLGYLLLGLGAFIALQMIWPGFAGLLFPAALIAAGVWLLRRP
jgi:phage shock protein C